MQASSANKIFIDDVSAKSAAADGIEGKAEGFATLATACNYRNWNSNRRITCTQGAIGF